MLEHIDKYMFAVILFLYMWFTLHSIVMMILITIKDYKRVNEELKRLASYKGKPRYIVKLDGYPSKGTILVREDEDDNYSSYHAYYMCVETGFRYFLHCDDITKLKVKNVLGGKLL